MGQIRGVHRADERDIVHTLRQVRHRLADPHTALAMLLEFERAAHQRASRLGKFHFAGDLVKVRRAVLPIQLWLGIKQVHLARPTIHEQLDHRLRSGCVVRP